VLWFEEICATAFFGLVAFSDLLTCRTPLSFPMSSTFASGPAFLSVAFERVFLFSWFGDALYCFDLCVSKLFFESRLGFPPAARYGFQSKLSPS